MRPSNNIIAGPAPKTVVIKGKAHLFTLLSAIWTAFTLLGVFFFRDYRDPDIRSIIVTIVVVIWALHLIFIALSIFFWITETPKQVLTLESDGDGSGEDKC